MKIPPRVGPTTVVTPKTAPSAPWYLPRSRSGMTSAIRAMAVTISPPPPMPCTARAAISIGMEVAAPAKTEPPTKTTALSWKITFRPKRSPNLPTRTVETVSARR